MWDLKQTVKQLTAQSVPARCDQLGPSWFCYSSWLNRLKVKIGNSDAPGRMILRVSHLSPMRPGENLTTPFTDSLAIVWLMVAPGFQRLQKCLPGASSLLPLYFYLLAYITLDLLTGPLNSAPVLEM